MDSSLPNSGSMADCGAPMATVSDAAALPVDITVAVSKPNSLPTEIPTLLLRSLSDPVGKTVSFFQIEVG